MLAFAWGAFAPSAGGETLVGALVAERATTTAMVYIVIRVEANPLEIAAQLVAAAIDHASALGVKTIYARPQGLDRVWIRYGFMPVPEVALPAALAGRAGIGLYAWRGNSALWTLREAAND
jgi:N-acetylglutamate synthase-like GNAT family acetyltransferase